MYIPATITLILPSSEPAILDTRQEYTSEYGLVIPSKHNWVMFSAKLKQASLLLILSPFRSHWTISAGGEPASKSHLIQKSSPSKTKRSEVCSTVTIVLGVDSSVISSPEGLTTGGAVV